MSAEENKTLIRRLYDEGMNCRDPQASARFYALDARNHGVRVGREGMERLFGALFTVFPDWHYTIEQMVAEGDRVICNVTFRGTHLGVPPLASAFRGALNGVTPTGKRIQVSHVHIFRIINGEIAEHEAVRDDLAMMWQLGLLEIELL